MKIMTIHAFCQSVLRRFPLEAGVVPHFRVLEDRDAGELLEDAKADLLTRAHLDEGSLSAAVATVAARVHETLARSARQDGIEMVDLLEAFQGQSAEAFWVHPRDFHPNHEAHARAADFLLRRIAW